MIEERLVDPLEPVAGSLNGNGVAQMRESHARPRPVHDMLDQPRAHRIAEHVAEDREEMAILLNRKTFEAALGRRKGDRLLSRESLSAMWLWRDVRVAMKDW
jgi:hypothetical protein